MKTDLEKLQADFASLKEQYKKIEMKAQETVDPEDEKDDQEEMMSQIHNVMWQMYDNLYAQINRLASDTYTTMGEHNKNHCPKMTPTAMGKFVKMVGMENDYEVKKPVIYTYASNRGIVINVDDSDSN